MAVAVAEAATPAAGVADEWIVKAGGEFKRFAIILFKVVLDVINDDGLETKLLRVAFVVGPLEEVVVELDEV